MADWGYSWEAFQVTTEDGYILTTFHVTGKNGLSHEELPRNESLMPLVMMNGSGCDATTWVSTPPGTGVLKSLPLRLYDDGFDIWLAANRGT